MSAPTPAAPRRAPGALLFVLIAAMSAGPIFNFGISSLSAVIIDEFGISEAQYGALMTVIFVSAGITSVFLGRLADRITPRTQFAIILGGIIVAFLLSASWHTYAVLLIAALIAGPAQALSNPLTNRVIAQRVPAAQRGPWMGWKQSGVQMGMLVAGLTFPVVASFFGWRGAAIFGALLCVPVLVVAWIVMTRLRNARLQREADRAASGLPEPDTNTAGVAVGAPSTGAPMPAAVWLFALISFLNAVGTQGLNSFASLFAVRALDYSITTAGLVIGVIGVFGIASRIGWARVKGRVGQPAPLIMLMSFGGILGFAALTAAERYEIAWLMWLGVVLHAVLPLAANVIINSGIVDAAPAGRVGVASGLVAAGMYLGFSVGPALMGWIVNVTGSFAPGWVAMSGTYAAAIVVALILLRVQRARP